MVVPQLRGVATGARGWRRARVSPPGEIRWARGGHRCQLWMGQACTPRYGGCKALRVSLVTPGLLEAFLWVFCYGTTAPARWPGWRRSAVTARRGDAM